MSASKGYINKEIRTRLSCINSVTAFQSVTESALQIIAGRVSPGFAMHLTSNSIPLLL